MDRELLQQPFPYTDLSEATPSIIISSSICCGISGLLLCAALIQSWRFRKVSTTYYKIAMHLLIAANMIACFLSSLEIGPIFLPTWLFFALEEHMFAYSIASYIVLALFWVKFYCVLIWAGGLAFVDTWKFVILALFLPFLYSIGCSIYFYKCVSYFDQGFSILRKYFYVFHVILYIVVSCVLIAVAIATYKNLASSDMRKETKLKALRIITIVGVLTILKSIVFIALGAVDEGFYWNTVGGVYIYFFAEHFVPCIAFFILLRKQPPVLKRLTSNEKFRGKVKAKAVGDSHISMLPQQIIVK